jgi:hypothetical protein
MINAYRILMIRIVTEIARYIFKFSGTLMIKGVIKEELFQNL